jgi:hypothetical protein
VNSSALDTIFPNRRTVIDRDGGCAAALVDLFIPAAVLLEVTDSQVEGLTPKWRGFTRSIAGAAARSAETGEALAS